MTKNDDFYVGIDGSVEMRRALLEISKSFVFMLKNYERLRPVREKKKWEIEKFKNITKEIGNDVAQLKAKLPHFRLSELPKHAAITTARADKEGGKAISKAKGVPPQAFRLEKELDAIEQRLKRL